MVLFGARALTGPTARLDDEYLLSVVVARDGWEQIDFAHLDQIDVTECLSRFKLRRTMTKTGVFKPVEPFGRDSP